MTAKIESHAKLSHGRPLPDHLDPAKQPGGKLKNDHEAGPSEAARQKPESAVHPLALWIGGWPVPDRTPGDHPDRTPAASEAVSPHAARQDPQAGSGPGKSNAAGQAGGLFPSGADSEDVDLMNAVIGNPGKWRDLEAGIRKMKEEDAGLDRNPFIAAYLDPANKSPDHVKSNWDKMPAPGHPLFADFMVTEHPEYYPSRAERSNSAPRGIGPDQAPEGGDRLRRAQSLPADLSSLTPPTHELVPPVPAQGTEAAPSVTGGPVDPRLEELSQENARLQKKAQGAAYKAYLAGIVGAGAGVAAGLVIASEVGDSSSNAPGNS